MTDIDFSQTRPEDWIDTLPASIRGLINAQLAAGMSYEDIAREWLSKFGPENTYPFGANGSGENVYNKIYTEIKNLFCGHPDYNDIRKKAFASYEQNKVPVLTAIAGFVGSQIGIAAAVAMPIVALIIALISKIGLRVFCSR